MQHTAALDQDGLVIISGSNAHGQLGCGALKPSKGTLIVRGPLAGVQVRASTHIHVRKCVAYVGDMVAHIPITAPKRSRCVSDVFSKLANDACV